MALIQHAPHTMMALAVWPNATRRITRRALKRLRKKQNAILAARDPSSTCHNVQTQNHGNAVIRRIVCSHVCIYVWVDQRVWFIEKNMLEVQGGNHVASRPRA